MDHVVLPLDQPHLAAVTALAARAAAAAGTPGSHEGCRPHVTMVAYAGLDRAAAVAALETAVRDTAPMVLHAHGYGFFTGDDPYDSSLHVPVVRTRPLDELHRRVFTALEELGAEVARWTQPEIWSPHVTLLDRDLDPGRLAAAAGCLAERHHPSWRIAVDRLLLTGGWDERYRPGESVPFGR